MKAEIWVGICDAGGYTVVVAASSQDLAERQLYRKWRETVCKGFEPAVVSFDTLAEWNGAHVTQITVDKGAVIWEQTQ